MRSCFICRLRGICRDVYKKEKGGCPSVADLLCGSKVDTNGFGLGEGGELEVQM